VTHTTFQELPLTPFTVHEFLEFEILSSEKHFCHEEISQILFRERFRRLDLWPEPLEKEINEILGSKREDRLSDPFFWIGTKYHFGSFFVPASPLQFL